MWQLPCHPSLPPPCLFTLSAWLTDRMISVLQYNTAETLFMEYVELLCRSHTIFPVRRVHHLTNALRPKYTLMQCAISLVTFCPDRALHMLDAKNRQLNPDQSSLKGWEGKRERKVWGMEASRCNLTRGYLWFKTICVQNSYTQHVIMSA